MVALSKSLCVRPSGPDAVIFWFGALWATNAASRIVKSRPTEARIRVVVVIEGTGAGQCAMGGGSPAQRAHVG